MRELLKDRTASFHCLFSLTAISCSFISARLSVCVWVRVFKSLFNTSAICTEICLCLFFSLNHDLLWLHFRYFWSANKWWNATRRNSALGFIAESSRVESEWRRRWRWRWLQHSFAAYDVDVKFMCGVCFACEQGTPPEKVETFSRPSPVNC